MNQAIRENRAGALDQQEVDTPIGRVRLFANAQGITGVRFVDGIDAEGPRELAGTAEVAAIDRAQQWLTALSRQLAEYFGGSRRSFDVPLAPFGTPFQRRAWDALTRIPFGTTRTYAQIACEIGSPQAVRAVGAANGANRIAIVIPCHRVIGADGTLTGFGGGLWRKEWLLEHEGGTPRLPMFTA